MTLSYWALWAHCLCRWVRPSWILALQFRFMSVQILHISFSELGLETCQRWTGSDLKTPIGSIAKLTCLKVYAEFVRKSSLAFYKLTQLILLFCAWLHGLASSGTLVGYIRLLSSLGSFHRWKPLDLYQDKLRGKYWSLVKCQGKCSSSSKKITFSPLLCKGNTNTHIASTV